MRLVGRRQAIIAAILRLTISEQGWECQVYRRYGMSLDRIVSHVCCVMYITFGRCGWGCNRLRPLECSPPGACHKHRGARARRARGSLRERSDVVDGHRSLLPSPRLSCRLAQELAS